MTLTVFVTFKKIEDIEPEREGKYFSYQKFVIKLKFKKNCSTNIIDNICVPSTHFIEPGLSDNFDSKTNLVFKQYKPNDTVTVHGIFFSSKEKKYIFSTESRTLFYLVGKNNLYLKDVPSSQICDELNRYFNVGKELAQFMGNVQGDETYLNEKDLKLADRDGLIVIGFEAFRTSYFKDYKEGKLNKEELINTLTGISSIPYAHFENHLLKCE